MRGLRRRTGAFVALVALLGAAAAALELAGGALPPPPLRAPERWSVWLSRRDPVIVAFSVVRLLALVLAWYALVVTVAGAGARLLAAARLAAGLDRLTLPPLRRLLAATLSVGIGTASLTPGTGRGAPVPAAAAAQASTTTTAPLADSLTMHELPLLGDVPAPVAPIEPVEPQRRHTWTVRPGQCFWSIAEDVLASTLGRRPSEAEVVPYWRRLVDVNRTGLADGDNPDLVFPGQVFTVPDPDRG